MTLNINFMPGPTQEARKLQFEQCKAYDAWCEARLKAEHEGAGALPSVAAARADYDQTVIALIALLGNDVHCNLVDTDLFGEFSDYYKDVVGVRPRQHITRSEVLEWMATDHAQAA